MSGGSVPTYDEIIVLMKNFDKIIKYDEITNILMCEGGCLLADV